MTITTALLVFLATSSAIPAGTRSIVDERLVCEGPTAGLPERLPFSTGAVDFDSGDEVTIEAVYGCAERFEPDGVYVVTGRYRLESRNEAVLLVGATATTDVQSPWEPSTLRVRKGTGTFRLVLHLFEGGKPHATMYDAETGRPFSGLYFGAGDTVLRFKTWKYERRGATEHTVSD